MGKKIKLQVEHLNPDVAESLRNLGPEKRVQMMFELIDLLVSVVKAGIIFQHPDWSEIDVEREKARRISRGVA